jgi:hypothetical protein
LKSTFKVILADPRPAVKPLVAPCQTVAPDDTFRRMEQAERPLGLGILSVVSLGVALYNVQSGAYLVLLLLGKLALPEAPELRAAYEALPEWFRWFLIVAAAVKVVLLVGAALAYFRQRARGRVLGSAYGLFSLAESAVAVATFGVVGRDAIIGGLFALFTLVALNTMYKGNLSR